MKGKHQQVGDVSGATCSYANFAGTISHSFNCTMSKMQDECVSIIDSGACDHMTYDDSILSNKRILNKPTKVGLPNYQDSDIYMLILWEMLF